MATILTWPSGNPAIASRAVSLASAWMTAAPPSALGSMMASGRAATTASRSSSISPVVSPVTRTGRCGRAACGAVSLTNAAASSRARALPSGAIESSRSTITASAPLVIALSSFLPPSAGTNRNERIADSICSGSLRPHAHERLAAAFGDQLVVLVVGAVVEFDDAGARPRFRLALGDHLGGAMDGVALEQRMGKLHVGHAEIGDGGTDRHVGHLDADHQPEREQRVHQRLAPLGLLLAEVPVDVQRLRVERHVGEQHVVHLRHRAGKAVLGELADYEILEIEPAALVADRGLGRHVILLAAGASVGARAEILTVRLPYLPTMRTHVSPAGRPRRMFVDSTGTQGTAVIGAIRNAARQTGADFQYLLATAQVESGLNPTASVSSSSAKGLFQFIDQTWLTTLKESGPAVGYGRYADAIVQTPSGHYTVPDPAMRQQIMALRDDPAANAAMAGAFTQQNAAVLRQRIGRTPSEGDLYVAHFLGAGGASQLINLANQSPGKI